jgi:TetR/AcrR family transcriptional regulator, mexJK operon transcriptional repressor
MSKDKRIRILEAAEKEFSYNGYKKASIVRIAAEAEVAVGTMYSYFTNKDSLFDAVGRPELKNYNPVKDEIRTGILKAALKEFGENGYAATTMDTVADTCGLNKAVIYRYFNSKDELFTAIFNEQKFTYSLENLRLSPTSTDLTDALKKMGMTFLELFEDPDRTNILKMVISETNRFPHLGLLMYENTVQKVSECVAEILKQLADQGVIAETDFRLAARSYFGLLYSFILTDKILNPNGEKFNTSK